MFLLPFLVVFVLSLGLVGVLYYLKIMSVQKATEAILARQASHSQPTSRLGGVACIISMMIGSFFINDANIYFLIVSSFPVFVAGGLEDLGYGVKANFRLFFAIISGFLAILLTGIWLDDVDLTILKPILAIVPIAVCFTAFASAGISNSINLIDGVNGLSSGVIAIISASLGFICFSFEEIFLCKLCLALLASIMGFFIWNYPRGLVFLGDAGAYTYGHILTWISILLVSRHPEISAWAIFCVFFWPIADTGFAICRRLIKGRPINEPDRMHFHQLVMRCLIIYSKGRIPRSMANPLSTLIILPFCLFVALLGTLFVQNNSLSLIVILCSVLTFIVSYRLLIFTARLKW